MYCRKIFPSLETPLTRVAHKSSGSLPVIFRLGFLNGCANFVSHKISPFPLFFPGGRAEKLARKWQTTAQQLLEKEMLNYKKDTTKIQTCQKITQNKGMSD